MSQGALLGPTGPRLGQLFLLLFLKEQHIGLYWQFWIRCHTWAYRGSGLVLNDFLCEHRYSLNNRLEANLAVWGKNVFNVQADKNAGPLIGMNRHAQQKKISDLNDSAVRQVLRCRPCVRCKSKRINYKTTSSICSSESYADKFEHETSCFVLHYPVRGSAKNNLTHVALQGRGTTSWL